MVWGSLISSVFSLIPLIQDFESFYRQHDDFLPALDFQLTWSLLVFSGIVYGLGSLAFVRAFEEPPKTPLFHKFKHLQTDELLGAWLFLIGTVPAVPYTLVYFSVRPSATYFFGMIASVLLVAATFLFVRACYPTRTGKVSLFLIFSMNLLYQHEKRLNIY